LEIKLNMMRTLAAFLIVTTLYCSITSSTRICAQTAISQDVTQTTISAPSSVDVQREFRFLSTNKVATMEKELNELAAQGFRLERVSKSSLDDELATLVTHDPAAQSNARYEYKLISTRRTGTMEKEIMEAADQGFELRGLTSLFRTGIGIFIGDETVVVMERSAGETARRYDFKLLSTRREKTMQGELDKIVAEGYTPLEMAFSQDNGASSILLGPQFVNTIILGRLAGSGGSGTSVAAREYKFLTTGKVGTMEREMNRATKEGYRFYMSAPDLRMLMYR